MPQPATNTPSLAPTADFWGWLVEFNTMREQLRGQGAVVTPGSLRLELMLRCMPREHRVPILDKHGTSHSGWAKWCSNPRPTPGPVVADVIAYWQEKAGRVIELHEVYEPAFPTPAEHAA